MGISYKKLKELQNRQITEMSRMTPENVKLYDEICSLARHAPADERTQEEWILTAAKSIVRAQQENKPARDLYGTDLKKDIYAQLGITDADTRVSQSTDVRKKSSANKEQTASSSESSEPMQRTPKWYFMIAWAAISVVLLIQGCAGLFIGWTEGDTEPFEHISLFSLIITALGGIALVEMLRRLAERPDDQGADKNVLPKINLKGIAIYIVIVVLVLFVGYPLRDRLPVFPLAPWMSAVIGIAGLVTLKPIFGQKKSA